jgi:hypothetical protein
MQKEYEKRMKDFSQGVFWTAGPRETNIGFLHR